ncbi:YciI family protein [Arthrobacter sp. YAF16]|uniref:YciI family protein n=1 Tax=Arthrobacter sp. YAF16 TaxID=3233076 RepID=UPI003F8EA2E1
MDFVVLYTLREGADRSRILKTFPRHKAYYKAFREAGGGLVAPGPFQTADPAAGSMGIFTSREDAERFIAEDPFTVEGLVDPRILEWNAVRFE